MKWGSAFEMEAVNYLDLSSFEEGLVRCLDEIDREIIKEEFRRSGETVV